MEEETEEEIVEKIDIYLSNMLNIEDLMDDVKLNSYYIYNDLSGLMVIDIKELSNYDAIYLYDMFHHIVFVVKRKYIYVDKDDKHYIKNIKDLIPLTNTKIKLYNSIVRSIKSYFVRTHIYDNLLDEIISDKIDKFINLDL